MENIVLAYKSNLSNIIYGIYKYVPIVVKEHNIVATWEWEYGSYAYKYSILNKVLDNAFIGKPYS